MEAQEYKDIVNLLAKTKIDYAITSKGYRDINEPMVVVIHSLVSGTNTPKMIRAKKALKWYSDTWVLVDTHVDSIVAPTNLVPQVFIDSLTLPTI